MIIIISLAVIMGLGIWLGKKDTDLDFLSFIITGLAGFMLFFAIIFIPIEHYSANADIQKYYSLKQTIIEARQRGTEPIERAALTQKIAENNTLFAAYKYWNKTVFNDYIPDEVDMIEPLR